MIPPKVGVSRILDEVFEDERKVDEDDDIPAPGAADEDGDGKGKKGGAGGAKTKSAARKSKAAAGTLAEALEDEEMDGVVESEQGDQEGDEEMPRPKAPSPYWCTVYGQYMLASSSHHGALCESLRTSPFSFSLLIRARLLDSGIRDRPVRFVSLSHDCPSLLWPGDEPTVR